MGHAMDDEAAHRRPVPGTTEGMQGIVDAPLGFEELTDAPVMGGGIVRAAALLQAGVEVGAQHFVVAIRALLIDGDREQLVVLEVLEHRGSSRCAR